MRCRRLDYRYALVFQSNHQLGEERLSGKVNVVVGSSHWCPAADVYETNDEIMISLDIAGADPEKLEILLYEDALVVAGSRSLKPSSKKGKYHVAEIRQGAFCFEFPLAEAFNPDQVEMRYDNGLLSLTLKKQAGGSRGA